MKSWQSDFPPTDQLGEPAWCRMRGTQAGRPATEEDMAEEAQDLYASLVPPAEAKK